MKGLLLVLAVAGCGHQPRSEPEGPLAAPVGAYEQAADRALTFLDETGFVVSRNPQGEPKHHGDSLIFTGLLVASLDCERGLRPSQAILEMPPEFWRHRILAGQKVSLDQALGAYQAVAYRIKACGERERWRLFLAQHAEVFEQGGGPDVPPFFDHVRDRLFEEGGVYKKTHLAAVSKKTQEVTGQDNRRKLELEMAAWALAVKLKKAACYRINLALMSFETLELLGDKVGGGEFCANTKGMGLATVDHWCGREGLQAYIDSYKVNEMQYAHQRCRAWEEADGNGDSHPGIDYLRALFYTRSTQPTHLR